MKLTVVPPDKTIVIDGVAVTPCTHVDLSWIPSDVHGMCFDTTTGKGFIEYEEDAVDANGDKKWGEDITEIGIWQQAVTDHANEQTLAAAAYEAAPSPTIKRRILLSRTKPAAWMMPQGA